MKYDALVIGSGQAGNPLARALAGAGQKVAMAEGADIGGSCVNYGCSPSKTIVASARIAHLVRRSADFGITSGEFTLDFGKVMARQKDVVHQFRQSDSEKLKYLGVTIYPHYAEFEDAHHIRVGDDVIEANRIYINTGARAQVPAIPGLVESGFLDYDSLLDLTELPEHLIILGGGYIGAEYAQAYRRFGSRVTVLEGGAQFLSHEDRDIARTIHSFLSHEGIEIVTEVKVTQVERIDGHIHLTVNHQGRVETIDGSHLLVAAGRVPNSDRLNLDRVGVAVNSRGFIETDDQLRTNVPHIWALGDVNGKGAFTHTSYNDYEIVWNNLNGGSRKVTDRISIYAVFIDPPLGRVGMSEDEVRHSGRKALISTLKMKHVNRAIERDETLGFMKILVDADSQQFLGASFLGIEADELIHIIADQMYAKAPYTVMRDAVHTHPTIAELLPTMLQNLRPLE